MILATGLRREMQDILDDMQSDIANELEKVSLERLADINPDLLLNIKRAAEDSVGVGTTMGQRNSGGGGSTNRSNDTSNKRSGSSNNSSKLQSNQHQQQLPAFLTETRSDAAVSRSDAWSEFMVKQHNSNNRQDGDDGMQQQAESIIAALHQLVTTGTAESNAAVYTQRDALKMTDYYSACIAVAQLLSTTLLESAESSKKRSAANDSNNNIRSRNSAAATDSAKSTTGRAGLAVDQTEFTNDGIKRHNPAAVSLLYEIGLPFQSAADGRRFRTQLQLSNHLDYLFKKNQLEKTIAVTEERGWYVVDPVWTLEQKEDLLDQQQQETDETDADDPAASTVPADESRDCCVVCGIHFKMFFDNDDGVYKYSNCIEMAVMNDDASENESDQQLVHATCWKGLGQPAVLTFDQTLQEKLRH